MYPNICEGQAALSTQCTFLVICKTYILLLSAIQPMIKQWPPTGICHMCCWHWCKPVPQIVPTRHGMQSKKIQHAQHPQGTKGSDCQNSQHSQWKNFKVKGVVQLTQMRCQTHSLAMLACCSFLELILGFSSIFFLSLSLPVFQSCFFLLSLF